MRCWMLSRLSSTNLAWEDQTLKLGSLPLMVPFLSNPSTGSYVIEGQDAMPLRSFSKANAQRRLMPSFGWLVITKF